MKPMIGPQWPMRPGSRAVWPKLPKEQPTTAAPSPTPAVQLNQTSETNAEKKRRFVYERPTLPDRAPKLPNNWGTPTARKGKTKNQNGEKNDLKAGEIFRRAGIGKGSGPRRRHEQRAGAVCVGP